MYYFLILEDKMKRNNEAILCSLSQFVEPHIFFDAEKNYGDNFKQRLVRIENGNLGHEKKESS